MRDPPVLQPAAAHIASRAHQLRSTSDSPTRQRHTDDLIAHLNPRTAVDTFRNPSGALKVCMDASTPSEQAFALRAAMASRNIQEWLEELSAWPWPAGDSSTGFDRPPPKRRKLSCDEGGISESGEALKDQLCDDQVYLGSLLATVVSRYESRVDEICRDMEELDVDDIKTHVLHNHIIPLSRPGTPLSESNRISISSLSAYARMDDLTALITATIIQALPNLSRLTRLMDTWSVRLAVLRKTSNFLSTLADAEVALQSGWNAMDLAAKAMGSEGARESTLSGNDFNVMKLVLERKVSKSGQHLDYMLDTLEGRQDTLPEDWIDRMDALERGYGEWAAACERKLREAEWAAVVRETEAAMGPSVVADESAAHSRDHEEDDVMLPVHRASADPGINDQTGIPSVTDTITKRRSDVLIKVHPAEATNNAIGEDKPGTSSVDVDGQDDPAALHLRTENLRRLATNSGQYNTERPELGTPEASEEAGNPSAIRKSLDESLGASSQPDSPLEYSGSQLQSSEQVAPFFLRSDRLTEQGEANLNLPDISEDFDSMLDMLPDIDIPEPDLPTYPRQRRRSDASNASTVIHGSPSTFTDLPSDPPDHGTPVRVRDVGTKPNYGDNTSSPSSVPDFRSSTRSLSVSFNDIPTVVEVPNEETPPRTPIDFSAIDDDDLTREEPDSLASPGKTGMTSADEQLQQQISDILESIPAKIRLTTELPEVNLNPPDFTMPTRAKPKPDPIPRGHSSWSNLSSRASSRSGTPSFTLAPAYGRNSRPRIQRGGDPEIKLYHLSRSNGAAPIKLFIRCVGETGERVMVRVGGGWADLGEYLKEYATHHGRRPGGEGKIEIRDLPRVVAAGSRAGSSPPSRPGSALDTSSPVTPLTVRKTRKSTGGGEDTATLKLPRTPLASVATQPADTPSSEVSTRSRSSSRLSWTEEDSSLGMAGPKARNVEMSEENKAWVESVKEKVRIASGERKVSSGDQLSDGRFGDIGKVGGTKRVFRRQP